LAASSATLCLFRGTLSRVIFMSLFRTVVVATAMLAALAGTLAAQKTGAAQKPGERAAQPATPEQAARVLDLRKFPRMEGANVGSLHTLGMLMYEAKGQPKAAFDFQRQQLAKLGFQEMKGGYASPQSASGYFAKGGFTVSVSASEVSGDPKKAGWSNVTLVNSGNIDLAKLPVPPGTKPFHPSPIEASYTTSAKVQPTAAECRKLLLAAGWEPYGQAGNGGNESDSAMQYFKQNAIKLQLWVMTTPVEGGKTLIRYSTDLLSADLPAPPDATDPRYDDEQKTLRMDEPSPRTDAILAFYQERLPKLGWKATTDRPIVDDRTKSQFLVFRNAHKDLLSLDMAQFTDIVRVTLRHQTEAEVAEEEFLAKAEAEKQRLADEKRNRKVKVSLPLPAKAEKVEKDANRLEFTLANGSGPATLTAFRDHFKKQGWTEEEGTDLGENTGEIDFKKDMLALRISYFDIGFGGAEFTVSGSPNVVLETTTAKGSQSDKPAAESPKAKAKKPAIPGLPDLPPGVELPDDVKELLDKALKKP
jgi:hypothetical protein